MSGFIWQENLLILNILQNEKFTRNVSSRDERDGRRLRFWTIFFSSDSCGINNLFNKRLTRL